MATSCASPFLAAESSVSITTSTKGFYESDQMQVKSPSSPPSSEQSAIFLSSHHGHAFLGNDTYIHDQELIPPTSRLSRLPFTQPTHSSTTNVAIPALKTNNTHTHTGQDVHEFVNSSASLSSSPVTRTFGHQSNPPETSVSSSQLLTNHVLSHPIRRPRTYNTVFQSSRDLAAHYGIPEILPPAPTTTTTRHQSAKSPIHVDFQTLSSNYLSMLSQNPSDNTNMTDFVAPSSTVVTEEELSAPVIPEEDDDVAKSFATMLAPQSNTWEMATPSLMDDISPWSPDNMHFGTPQDSIMDTPLFDYLDDSHLLTGPDYPLFPAFPEWSTLDDAATHAKSLPVLDVSALLTISPSSPSLESFDPQLSVSQPSTALPVVPVVKPTVPRSKVNVTGIRKGVTPETLLDESAPTQLRNYATPSATSRKEIPAVFARKRARSTAFGDEEDQLDDYVLPPNPTEKDLIEQKRRQNTVAARRSRKRKLEHVQLLEKSLEEEKRQKEQWRQRALMLSSILSGLNQPVPDFSAEEA